MGELLMRAAAIVERRQALRNAGNGDINRGRFEPRKVYGVRRCTARGSQSRPDATPVLRTWSAGFREGVMALADWMLRVQYGWDSDARD